MSIFITFVKYIFFQSNIIPVCLPWGRNDPGRNELIGSNFTVSGWGKITKWNVTDSLSDCGRLKFRAKILQAATIPSVSNSKCTNYPIYRDLNIDTKTQFCAGGIKGTYCLNFLKVP